MSTQQKVNELTKIKNSLYDLASFKWAKGDKAGQQAAYAEIDAINAEIDAVMKANEEPLATDEELTLKFDN